MNGQGVLKIDGEKEVLLLLFFAVDKASMANILRLHQALEGEH